MCWFVVECGFIVIGLLYVVYGFMVVSEDVFVVVVRLVVDDINVGGGLFGCCVEFCFEDFGSDFVVVVWCLIDLQYVVVLFGCWIIVCCEVVWLVVEVCCYLFFYLLVYEGMEQLFYIVYIGFMFNQQIFLVIDWVMYGFGWCIYLIGIEGLFIDCVYVLLCEFIMLGGGYVLGECVLFLGLGDVGVVIVDFQILQFDLVVNILIGDSNGVFFDVFVVVVLIDLLMFFFCVVEFEMWVYGGGWLDWNFMVWGYL